MNLFANVTKYDGSTQTTLFNETRLSINADGQVAPCGECKTTQQFGFEVCQAQGQYGYNGL